MLKFYPPTGLDRSATNSFRPDASWGSRLTCLVVFLLLSLSSPLLAQYNTNGVTVAGTGTAGSAANQLNFPVVIYVDEAGSMYIAEYNNHRVQKWASGATSGTTVAGTGTAGSAANQLNHPLGVYVDGAGAIYVSDADNHRVQKWASGATSGTTVAGTGTAGSAANQLNLPHGLYVDGAGAIYVSDVSNYRIQKWAAGATSATTVAGGNGAGSAANQLGGAAGVYIDGAGAIYVADGGNNRIQKWASGATSGTTVAGTGVYGPASNQLSYPFAVYVDGAGTMYVSDQQSHRIQKWTAGATSGTTVAGGDGNDGLLPYRLNYPRGIYLDRAGAIYVADGNNNRIQKFNLITPLVTPTLTIATTSSQTSCAGTSVSFTATPTNGGTSPSYQWKKNGTNVGTNTATYTDAALANNDVISCVLTSNATGTTTPTATANTLTMTVNARPDAPALTPASSSLAATLTPLSLTSFALATTDNSLHFFQAGGSELSPPTVSIATAGVMSFSVGQTSNASGCKSLLTPLSLTITATPTSQTVCRSSNATLNVTLVGTAFQWYKNGTTTANKLTELVSTQRGTTTATLTLVNLQTTADYYCKINTSTGVQTVGPLKVSVNFGCSARPAVEEANLQLLVLVRPNPIVDGHLRALVKGAQGQALNVAIYSLQGELVNQQVWDSAPAEVNLDWDISQRSMGVLLLRAQTPTQQQTIRLIQN